MGSKKELAQTKREAFTAIADFMSNKPVILTSEEETILNRWIVADGWFRQNKLTSDDIADKLVADFGVSKFTALNDIRNAQKLFALTRTINKRYVNHLHLERINRDVEETRDRLFFMDGPVPGTKVSRIPDAKELMALARLHEAYTNCFNSLPETEKANVLPPPVFVFNQVGGTGISPTMDLNAALAAADSFITAADEYIDHEDLPDDEQ
jgi:hypothetical protein